MGVADKKKTICSSLEPSQALRSEDNQFFAVFDSLTMVRICCNVKTSSSGDFGADRQMTDDRHKRLLYLAHAWSNDMQVSWLLMQGQL